NAELDPLLLWHLGVTLRHAALDIDGTPHRVHDAAELSQQPISGVLDNPPSVLSDLGIDKGTQVILEPSVRALLVKAGQPAVSGHIGSQDRSKAALDSLGGQACAPG